MFFNLQLIKGKRKVLFLSVVIVQLLGLAPWKVIEDNSSRYYVSK